jgi:hypothetical protein
VSRSLPDPASVRTLLLDAGGVGGARAAGVRAVLRDEAGLYREADCPRVASRGELADHLAPAPALRDFC